MKHSSQEIEPGIFTLSICGQLKIHMQFFQHITNSGSPSTFDLVFVVIIYQDPTYFHIGLQGRVTSFFGKTACLISSSMRH
jgi:hypothetical protein